MAVSKSIVCTDSLSIDRINNEFDEDLIVCPICTNILWKPITCKICENSFCLKCIRLWLNQKPNQCPFNCHFQERKCLGILLKLLSKLKLSCENKINGCQISIDYEALEKHQLNECQFRFIKCLNCFKEILSKDFHIHQKELCLQKQSIIIQEAFDDSKKHPERIPLNFNKLYKRENINLDYATRTQLDNSTQDYIVTPSAPFEESDSPSTESLRISTIKFCRIFGSKKEGSYIPNGYATFNWENAYYMYKEYASKYYQLKGFLNAFKDCQDCVAFNGNGKSMSIFLSNPTNKFGLHSFEALSIYHDNFKLSLTGYRSNQIIYIKHIILNNKYPILFRIDWKQIDNIIFTPSTIDYISTLKPETFALTYLNVILEFNN